MVSQNPSEQTFVSQVIVMTGSCWRLLAAIFVIILATVMSRGQDVAADLSPTTLPVSGRAPLALVRVPTGVSARDPVARGTIAFPQIVRAAGIIFSGRVTSVGRAEDRGETSPGQSFASTSVTFQVEHALRGSTTGQSLTIHEWSGLSAAREHYHVGERVFLFLYSPSKLGLTSPVAGAVGRFAIDPQGNIAMNAQNRRALSAEPVIGGRDLVRYVDFINALRRAGSEE